MGYLQARSLLSSLLQRRFLKTYAASLPHKGILSSYTYQFLVNSVGISPESAVSASRRFQLDEIRDKRSKSLVELLKSFEFNGTQIAKLFEKKPQILFYRVEDNLRPKMEFLSKSGFAGKLLPELVLSNPAILMTSLDYVIKPSFDILNLFLDSEKQVVAAIKRTTYLLTSDLKNTVKPNLDFLMKEGVPVSNLKKMLILNARGLIYKHYKLVNVVNIVKSLGLEPKASMFIHAVTVRICMRDSTWEKKFHMLNSLGISDTEIVLAFKRFPYLLAVSEKKIRTILDFCVNTMNIELQDILAYPHLFRFSIERRIRPRFKVLKVLKSQELIKQDKKVVWLLMKSKKYFFDEFVTKYMDKVPGLLEIYNSTKKG